MKKFLYELMHRPRLMVSIVHLMSYFLITIFYILRPLLGPSHCRFSLSCGDYAIKQLKEQPLIPAIVAICKRLWQCRPWGPTDTELQ